MLVCLVFIFIFVGCFNWLRLYVSFVYLSVLACSDFAAVDSLYTLCCVVVVCLLLVRSSTYSNLVSPTSFVLYRGYDQF